MKTKLLTALCAIALLCTATPASANDDKSLDVVADVGLVRPGCLLATVGGTALFVLTLPFAAASKSVKKTAHTLVTMPAKATFTRPLGDFETLQD